MVKDIPPFPPAFPDQLASYYEQAVAAAKKHHDTRRHLLLNFLRESFNVDPLEVELEQKVKVDEVRGRIDALFRHIIIEVKTDFERERDDAQRELKKYFASRARPADYIGIVTDGRKFESWHLDHNNELTLIGALEMRPDQPLQAWRWLDQFISSGVRRIPTSDELVARFGTDTAVFNKAADRLAELYRRVEKEPTVSVKFREWNALLAKVYGSALGKPALFINHTYLTLISRIVVTLAFKGGPPKRSELRGLMDGVYFSRQLNLKNLAEPDFFSWPLDTPAEADFVNLIDDLFEHFRFFDFAKLSEDILKHLYQELIDPETRHDLGEYYTPDWLAELTVERLKYKGGRFLDPACGSGAFLFAAVNALRKSGLKGKALVAHALEEVIGIDVHPVAVLMSKANFLLALRHELGGYGKDVTVCVYMADTLMAEEDTSAGVLKIAVHGKDVFTIPFETIAREGLDELVDFLSGFASRGSKNEAAEEKAWEAVRKRLEGLSQREVSCWRHNFRLMLKLDKERRNSIWAYILKNAYRPEFLRREKVDYIAGNPPWLSYRYIKEETYKKRVKALTFEHGLLQRDEVKLFTQMDTSTLFVAHCEREFLRPKGKIGMVLPKTAILPAKQHLAFQRKGFTEVHDFTDVGPLFNVRTCMIIRQAPYAPKNVPRFQWTGQLRERNLSLADARQILTSEKDTISFDLVSGEYSPYFERFFQGATLMPRCLAFVEPVKDSQLNLDAPFIRTSEEAYAESKKEWRLRVDGTVERKFLFGSVLARHLMPFVVRKLSLVTLPVIETSHGDLKMIDAATALGEGFQHAHDWFDQAERIWSKGRKDEKMSLADRFDYTHLLTDQQPHAEFIVLTNKSGTNLCSAMLTPPETRRIGPMEIGGFIADSVTYRYYAVSEKEAHYLVGVLNAPVVNDAIKPFQPQGLMGERDIHRRPFEVCNIPPFDADNTLHKEIASVSAAARAELLPFVSKLPESVAQARKFARERVAGKLARLDELTRKLLDSSAPPPRRKKVSAQGELL